MICLSQSTWETIRGQHATQNEICSCQINHLEIFPCPFTSICHQEKSFPGTERTSGLGAMHHVCREGSYEPPLSLALPRGHWPGSPRTHSCPDLLLTPRGVWGKSPQILGLVEIFPRLKNPILGMKVSTSPFPVWLEP